MILIIKWQFLLFFSGRGKARHLSSNALNTSPHQDSPVRIRNNFSSSSISLSSHPSSPRDPPSSKNRHSYGSTSPVTPSHITTPGRHSLPAHSFIPASFRNTEILPNKQRHSSGNSTSSTGSNHRPSSRGTQNEESSGGPMSIKGWSTVQVKMLWWMNALISNKLTWMLFNFTYLQTTNKNPQVRIFFILKISYCRIVMKKNLEYNIYYLYSNLIDMKSWIMTRWQAQSSDQTRQDA